MDEPIYVWLARPPRLPWRGNHSIGVRRGLVGPQRPGPTQPQFVPSLTRSPVLDVTVDRGNWIDLL